MSRLQQMTAQMYNDEEKMNTDNPNPLTKSGEKIMASMVSQYGTKKGKKVFYSSINAGKKGSRGWHK